MDEGFLQVTNNEVDRITLGMQFRSDMEARSLMGLLQQCAAPGTTVDISSDLFLSFNLGIASWLCNLCTYQYYCLTILVLALRLLALGSVT